MCYKGYQGQINAIYLFTFFKSHTHFSSICLILSPYFLSVLLSLFTTSSQRCERTFLSSISWSMNDKCRWIAASYSCRWIASLCFASFSISFACRSVNSRCWFCTGETTEYGEKDVFSVGRKKDSSSNKSRTYDLLVTSQDALPLSYRRLVGIKATKLARFMWQTFRILLGRWTVDMRLCAMIEMWWWILSLAPVVQTLDSPIHWINHYPADKYYGNQLHYPLERDLPIG